jgi:hypothetical protein
MLQVTEAVMMKNLLLLTMIGLMLAGGCATGDAANRDRADQEIRELPILKQKSGVYSHLHKKVRIVVHDRASWAQIPLKEMDVDFERHMVLVAGMGPTLRDDVGIRITKVWQEDRRIHVQERQIHPGLDTVPSAQPASPWTMVVVPKSDLNVVGYSPEIPDEAFAGR